MAFQRNSGRQRPLFAFRWVIAGIALAVLVRLVAFQVYYVPSESMLPTLHVGDRVLVDKISHGWRDLQRGDVVVFDATDVWAGPEAQSLIAKRIIGLPGDHVVCSASGRVFVNGLLVDEPYLATAHTTRPFDVVVPAGRLWLLGDNRAASVDSSDFMSLPSGGSVPVNHVVGRVLTVVWPLGHAGILGSPQAEDSHDAA